MHMSVKLSQSPSDVLESEEVITCFSLSLSLEFFQQKSFVVKSKMAKRPIHHIHNIVECFVFKDTFSFYQIELKTSRSDLNYVHSSH